jgi:hypothetical protein
MVTRRFALLTVLTVLASPLPGLAQSAGGAVPAYEPVTPQAPPLRDGEALPRRTQDMAQSANGAAISSDFAQAYARRGKPRLALYWNRQLGETLSDWYSDVRVVERSEGNSSMSGDFNLTQSTNNQNSLEVQRRAQDSRRMATTESFEWEFQDAFLAPFMEAGATIIDRAAMIRLTGADMATTGNERTVETRALQGKADYLMEILVSPNSKSTTGYELRTRILDVKSGAIVATVNSKNLRDWNPEKDIVATNRGFTDPNDLEDDETFGPQGDNRYRATDQGFQKRTKPPKLSKIAQNLAYNTMAGLSRQWK